MAVKRTLSPKAVQAVVFGGAVVVASVVLLLVVAGRPGDWDESPLRKAAPEALTSSAMRTEEAQGRPDDGDVAGSADQAPEAAAEASPDEDADAPARASEEEPSPTPAEDGAGEPPPPPPPTPPRPDAPKPITPDSGPPPPSQAELLTGAELTEELFVEVSAEMVLANEAFTDSEAGRESLDEAIDGILARHKVGKLAFQRYSHELMADPERSTRIQDKILQRADALRIGDVSMEARDTPRARPPGKAGDE